MMVEKGNEFVGELVVNLKRYNRYWFGFFYLIVMFLIGCYYVFIIYVFFCGDCSKLKILGGIKDNKKLYMLSGFVNMFLFKYFGSLSWYLYDVVMIVNLGKLVGGLWWRLFIMFLFVCGLFFLVIRRIRRRRRVVSLKV